MDSDESWQVAYTCGIQRHVVLDGSVSMRKKGSNLQPKYAVNAQENRQSYAATWRANINEKSSGLQQRICLVSNYFWSLLGVITIIVSQPYGHDTSKIQTNEHTNERTDGKLTVAVGYCAIYVRIAR